MKHLTEKEIIKYNQTTLEEIKVKKADKHEILREGIVGHIVSQCKATKGDSYDVAGCLLKSLLKEHPFASGNRRTAWIATERFLEKNNVKLNVDNSGKQARVLQGIREGYYTDKEVKDWFISGKIRKFER